VTRFERGALRVRWLGGCVVVEHGGDIVLVDVPEGTAGRLTDDELARVSTLVLSSGVLRDHAGILPILEARSRWTADPVQVVLPLGEERAASVLEAWQRGWADSPGVVQDAVHPGASVTVGALTFEAVPIGRGEPRWQPEPAVQPVIALGWRIRCRDATVAIARSPVPDRAVERLLHGADLAIVEVGVETWPRSERRWRLRPDEAARVASGAGELWLVGDDGTFGVGAAH
jgi:hypothetical protein